MIIISKDNKDHEVRSNKKHKKHYIILKQSFRMYLCAAGFFVPEKEYALGINDPVVAATAVVKINEVRNSMNQKPLCELIYE